MRTATRHPHRLLARALLRATSSALALVLGACLFGGGPLLVRAFPGGAEIEGERYADPELDRALEEAFRRGGSREVILEASSDVSADVLASLMDRIHAASRAAGLEGDCNLEARALPSSAPQGAKASGAPESEASAAR
ncbi:MAG: hypothetical protein JNM84_05400 [Planctomycetes bacterium]|nr:hypothetical protein [Planctomycetota bacterium]